MFLKGGCQADSLEKRRKEMLNYRQFLLAARYKLSANRTLCSRIARFLPENRPILRRAEQRRGTKVKTQSDVPLLGFDQFVTSGLFVWKFSFEVLTTSLQILVITFMICCKLEDVRYFCEKSVTSLDIHANFGREAQVESKSSFYATCFRTPTLHSRRVIAQQKGSGSPPSITGIEQPFFVSFVVG